MRAMLLSTVATGLTLAFCLEGCERTSEPPAPVDPKAGDVLFKSYCASCHHTEGQIMGPAIPPLAGSEWVAGPEGRIIRIVLHGVRGSIKVADRSYNLEMPGFGQVLADAQIAAVLSYVRERYGGPSPPVATETVKRIRRETQTRSGYWTVEELLKVP